MSFISWQYALFLPLIFALYWRLAYRGRIWLLLGASYLFYGIWDARFLALLLTSTAIDFFCGLALTGRREKISKVLLAACLPAVWLLIYAGAVHQGTQVQNWILGVATTFPILFVAVYELLWRLPAARQRRAFLVLSVLTNLGVLGFFKYFNFCSDTAQALLAGLGMHTSWTLPRIILPVAISFYTFQSICYSVDIYRGKARPMTDFPTFAAYLSFFPQLIAGPIERPSHLLPQFEKAAVWNMEHLHKGIPLILVGLFKKVFVADNCALLANYAFDPATPLNGYWALLGGVAFAFQIYGDFSGYTDIARGSAKLLGIELTANFRFPYFAASPAEFWHRWHITLSTWFRDYVYIPLGGNRGGNFTQARNLGITMLLAGLWHGANWTFVLWGGYHGALLIAYHFSKCWKQAAEGEAAPRWQRAACIAGMWGLTLVGWAIFRCASLAELGRWFAGFGNWHATEVEWVRPGFWLLLHAVPLLVLQWLSWKQRDEVQLGRLHWAARGVAYVVLFMAAASSLAGDKEFIYFQF